ncbi:MAG: glycosyltransferase family 2 protein [Planctomycetota bacterium]|jgi:hypothetical protein
MKKVSIVCCTEDRPEFMPWMAHIFNSFKFPDGWMKELIVVDSTIDSERIYASLEQNVPASRMLFHWHNKPGCTIAEKSNIAMDMADCDLIGWLDDDDGRAPAWLAWAIEKLGDQDLLAVKTKVPFINIVMDPMKTRPLVPTKWWSAGLYRRSAVAQIEFLEKLPHGAPNVIGQDVQWQGWCWQRIPNKRQVHVHQEGVGFALSHRRNIANPAGKCAPVRWKYDVQKPEMWSKREWSKTLEEIQALRRRLHYVQQ